MYVLLTVEFTPEQIAELKALSPSLHIESRPLPPGSEAPTDLWEEAEVLYTFRFLPTPEQAPNLRWIQFHLAGIEEHLEAPILHKPDVIATTLSGANAPQVAEHACALMLGLAHNVNHMMIDQGQRKWSTKRGDSYQPTELLGSTVGIVGYGSVGQRLARILQSFNVKILATKHDILNAAKIDFQVDGSGDPSASLVHRLYPNKALRSMFKDCDFIVVSVPLTPGTRGMIGAKQLEAIKPGAFLIDVSRGGVVDHAALVQALKKNQLAGAALDVFPEEPLPADSPLWELNNVIISPHVAGLSRHYTTRAFTLFKENLRRYIAGEELLNKIDLEKGY
ncbi:MAG TPA: D-2-hydroxyacid dehydrogenase [Terriglobales bacterium]|nr:D-2-hydroxyacid dehydrogenase [Terriglobales bacterium]